jgi:DNA-binding CsgD family transcriptional regulator
MILKEIRLACLAIRRGLLRFSHLSDIDQPDIRLTMDVLLDMAGAAGYVDGRLLAILLSRAVRLSMKYGRSPATPKAFAAFAGMIGWATGDLKTMGRLGALAVELAEADGDLLVKREVYGALFPLFVRTVPLRDIGPYMARTSSYAKATGLPHANGTFASMQACTYYLAGKLRTLSRGLRLWYDGMPETSQPFLTAVFRMYRDFVLRLREGKDDPGILFRGEGAEPEWIEQIGRDEAASLLLGQYRAMSVQLWCLLGRHFEAAETALASRRTLNAVPYLPHYPDYWFYGAVATAAAVGTGRGGRSYLHQSLLSFKKWAAANPETYGHRYTLLRAEKARLRGRERKAAELYEQAVQEGRQYRSVLTAALAGERAAAFHSERGFEKTAAVFAFGAHRDYIRAGASVAAGRLAVQYAALWAREELILIGRERAAVREEGEETEVKPAASVPTEEADILLWMAEWNSADTDPGTLWPKLLQAVAKQAGAHKAALIIRRNGGLSLEAIASAEGCSRPCLPPDKSEYVCAALIQLAARTGDVVRVDDAASDGVFGGDAYIVRRRIRSVFVSPVQDIGKTVGYLYLENAAQPGVFASGRTDTWNLLAAQAIRALVEERHLESKSSVLYADPLTEREREVLGLLAQGMSNREMADHLGLTEGTVKIHLNRIYDKLGAKRRTQAVEEARNRGML